MIKRKNKAFTLAEVLLTLTIIGIVATLTVPALLVDMQERELKTAFLNEFSNFNQVFNKIQQDNIMPVSTPNDYHTKFLEYYTYIKTCANSSTEGCWHKNNEWFDLDGTAMGSGGGGRGVVLSSGAFLKYHTGSGGFAECTAYPSSPGGICDAFILDVNGFKGPNTWGRDIYTIFISSQRAIPGGQLSTLHYCEPTQSQSENGKGCALKILMNQDY